MTDIYDQATAQEEMARELALAALRSIKPCITPKGRCYNCNESIGREIVLRRELPRRLANA